jgi:LPXTG-motif cell wall-anchored protein
LAVALVALLALGFAGSAARAATVAQASTVVEMQDFQFAPKTLTIPVGATITWRNTGQAPHTAKADDGSFDTGRVNAGAEATTTFNTPGTFNYYCEFHGGPNGSGMAGTITVTAAQASAEPSASASASAEPSASASASAAPSASASAAPSTGVTPSIKVSDQPIVNNTITVAEVVAAQDGWVAVHKFGADGKPILTPIVGQTQVKAGTTTNVKVTITEAFNAGDKLLPMLHIDEGVKGTYEFPNGPDTPVSANGQVVAVPLTVQAAAAASAPPAATQPAPPAQLPSTGAAGWNPLLLAAVALLLAGLGLSLHLSRGRHAR